MYRLSSLILVLFGFTQIFAQSPHGDAFKMDCTKCHTSESWKINFKKLHFDHNTTSFALEGAHSKTDCIECHKTLVFNAASNKCTSCHTDMHNATVGNDCARCHTPKSWVVTKIPQLHQENGFPLTGPHNTINCIECHKSETKLRFDRIGNDCINCHRETYNNTTNPNHVTGNYSKNCIECHNPLLKQWTPSDFNHDFFPLTQGHSVADCNACHTTNNFADAKPDCVSCHQTTFDNTVNPKHIDAAFNTDCKVCHTTTPGWKPATFEHNFFPLTKGHNVQNCNACHLTTPNYANTPTNCVSCHQTNFNNTKNPSHVNNGFPTDCASCHTTNPGWTPSSFNHNSFPLTQGHNIPDCKQCHITANFADAKPDCVSCHKTKFDNTTNPNHVAAGFDTNCITCHTPGGWTPSTYDHSFFPLTQKHNLPDCTQCHNTTKYSDQKADCVSCHQAKFDNTTNPNHVGAGFDTNCIACHTPGGWTPSAFNHGFFPLTQGHNLPDCTQCHNIAKYSDQSTACVSCHQTNFNNTTNPNHVTSNFPTDCVTCHNTSPGWKPTTFNHTQFPLTLGHNITDCTQCHIGGNYTNTSPNCVSCHQTTYNNAKNPDHIAAGFPTDCKTCHNTNPGWKPAVFNHSQFPLTLGHNITNCTQCHIGGNYTNTSPNCVSCHQTTYNNAKNPDHIAANFPTDCKSCHNTNPGWKPATFNHSLFPLTLGHNLTGCIQCHKNGNYTNTSPICVSCHQTTFNNAKNPDHIAAGFPTDCKSCHTTNPGWKPSTFNHNQFPLTLGHNLTDCTQCHKNGNYTNTSPTCVSCHQTTYNNTTNPNHLTANFPTDCIACHTTNPGWKPSTFNHSSFPLTLGHNLTDCTLCHKNGNYTNTSPTCVSCHQTDFNNTKNPNHVIVGYSTDCKSCHTTNPNWTPSTFNHTQYFPITSGKHSGFTCNQCHTTPNNLSTFSCIACHEHSNKTSVDSDHKKVNGYSYVSSECYRCHPTGKEK